MMSIVLTFIRNFILFFLLFLSSKNFHFEAVKSLSQAPLDFFRATSSGNIISCFSGDFNQIDEYFIPALVNVIMFGLIIVGYLVAIMIMIPINLALVFIFFIGSILLGFQCISLIVKLTQIYLSSCGSIVSVFQECLDGIIYVRTLNLQQYFSHKLAKKINRNTQEYLNYIYSLRYFICLIGVGSALILGLNCFLIMIFLDKNSVNLASLSLTFNISIMTFLP